MARGWERAVMSGVLAMMTGGAPPDLVVDISNTAQPDIPALVQAAGWVGTSQKIRIVNTGLVNTLTIPSSLVGADITLVNAAGARIGGSTWSRSTALTLRVATKIQNLGIISGHGGDGGPGATAWISRAFSSVTQSALGSGGGGGQGQGFAYGIEITPFSETYGYSGTTGTLGATGSFGGPGRGAASATGGSGGAGGFWGQAGYPGGAGAISGDYDTGSAGTPGDGFPPGYYIDGASFATWLATGTRLGLSK